VVDCAWASEALHQNGCAESQAAQPSLKLPLRGLLLRLWSCRGELLPPLLHFAGGWHRLRSHGCCAAPRCEIAQAAESWVGRYPGNASINEGQQQRHQDVSSSVAELGLLGQAQADCVAASTGAARAACCTHHADQRGDQGQQQQLGLPQLLHPLSLPSLLHLLCFVLLKLWIQV